jgi:NADPH:quinone reductase-like Zn-dependent oxidoreductase
VSPVLLPLHGCCYTERGPYRSIGVGSTAAFRELNRFLDERKVKLDGIIDKVFAFDDSAKAIDYLYSGKHVGKVVIKV